MRFYLIFVSENDPNKYYIDEPTNFDGLDITLEQESGRYARDIAYSTGSDIEFNDRQNHGLKRLLFNFDKYGFEAKVVLGVEDIENLEFDIDFLQAKTDGITYLSCKLIQDTSLQLVKRNRDVKVDMFASEDVFGNPITPLTAQNILLKAKPITEISNWEQKQPLDVTLPFGSSAYNPIVWIDQSDINDSLVPFLQQVNGTTSGENFAYIEAEQNLRNIRIEIEQNFFATMDFSGGVNTIGLGGLRIAWGDTIQTAQVSAMFNYNIYNSGSGASQYTNNNNFVHTIPALERGQRVWIWYYMSTNGTNASNTARHRFRVTNGKMKITASEIAYNTIVPAIRLKDVTNQTLKASTALETVSPTLNSQPLLDQFLFSGNMLRNRLNRPFYLTIKEIEEGMQEFNIDYEITSDNKVFFGLMREFYNQNEIAFLPNTQFEQFNTGFNDRFAINTFSYAWKNYQSQKENSEQNTDDVVHGETQWKMPNLNADNSKEVSISWIRDPFLIAVNQRKAIAEASSTSTQDDDKLFILDVNTNLTGNSIPFTETDFLQHIWDSETERLTLENTGTFSWLLLGITVGGIFEITPNQPNAGTYQVAEVGNNTLVLSRFLASPTTANNGERATRFTYRVYTNTIVGVAWEDEGFGASENLLNPEEFPNLRFSAKRNILNYWQEFLATANLYRKNQTIKNTFYKNNPKAITTYEGFTVEEGADFVPSGNIVTPVLFNDMVYIVEFAKFVQLKNAMRSQRGFIRAINNNGNVIKFYPTKMDYNRATMELTVIGEEKYEPSLINIINNGNSLTVGDYTLNSINYETRGEEILLKDESGYLLYNPTFWHRISVNGNIATNLNQLKQWLELL